MEYELTLISVSLLIGAGFAAGFINTIAGGGSMLTLPALMILGMPADIANATNRVGVLMQSIAGAQGFHSRGKLAPSSIIPTLIPTLLGSFGGAALASYLPEVYLKPALLVTMLTMAAVMLIRPSTVAPPPGTPVRDMSPGTWCLLFFAGIYGGFIQAGIGFILLAALAGGLRYDLVRANALKLAITGALTLTALLVFILRDQVLWIPGLILAIGTVVGANISVRFAINVPQTVLKYVLFAMVALTCAVAYFS